MHTRTQKSIRTNHHPSITLMILLEMCPERCSNASARFLVHVRCLDPCLDGLQALVTYVREIVHSFDAHGVEDVPKTVPISTFDRVQEVFYRNLHDLVAVLLSFIIVAFISFGNWPQRASIHDL